MKKLFVLFLLTVFATNQYAMASGKDVSIVKKLVKNQMLAKFESLSDGEKQKLENSLYDGLNVIKEKVESMTDEEVSLTISESSTSIQNIDTNEEVKNIVNKLTNDEKNVIVSSISEEDILISNSLDSAIKSELASEFNKSKLELAHKIKGLNKIEILKKVNENKEKLKNNAGDIARALIVMGVVVGLAVLGLGLGLLIPGILASNMILVGFGSVVLGGGFIVGCVVLGMWFR